MAQVDGECCWAEDCQRVQVVMMQSERLEADTACMEVRRGRGPG